MNKCKDCSKFVPKKETMGHMLGTCLEEKNKVSMSLGFDESPPMYDMRFDYQSCAEYKPKEQPNE